MTQRWFERLTCTGCALWLSACPMDAAPAQTTNADAGTSEHAQAGRAADAPAAGSGSANAGAAAHTSDPSADAGTKQADGPPASASDMGTKPDHSMTPTPTPAPDAGMQPSAAGELGPRFFLPTPEPENTTAPKLEIDAQGGTHMIYPGYAGGDAYYAYCPKDCTDPKNIKVVRLQTDGTVANAMLKLTAAGKPRVLLSTYQRVYYAQCDDTCSQASGWSNSVILEHGSDREVTGNALALDSEGRPRFLIHTYLAYLGIGQKPPQTLYAQCDQRCNEASQWRFDAIAEDIWYASQLRFDAKGRAHVATGVVTRDMDGPSYKQAAYLVCEKDCGTAAAWSGIGLAPLFESQVEEIRPSLALALTKAGQPRVLALAQDPAGKRRLLYFECDTDCANDHWSGTSLSDLPELGSGLGLVLDPNDRPRFVFTLDGSIGLHYCESDHCTGDNAPWDLTKVEYAGEVPKDTIILWPNCSVDVWLLHDPALALAPDGSVRVGYQATDISGGVTTIDSTKPACVAGKDMTLSRMAVFKSYKK